MSVGESAVTMTAQRPYLLRAVYEWLLDNGCTPHLVVDATQSFVEVPQEHIQDGKIVLNIHPDAVTAFSMDNEQLSFEARFGGKPRRIWLPMVAIIAIYARENGAGTVFDDEPALHQSVDAQEQGEIEDVTGDPAEKPVQKRPTLKVVK